MTKLHSGLHNTLRTRTPWLLTLFLVGAIAPAASDPITEVEGLTEPFKSIDVAAPEPGVVTRIIVREGDLVRQGQVLASLDNEVHLATLAVAQKNMEAVGGLNSAVAEVQLRKDRLEKLEMLRAKEHARQEEVDRARAELTIAEAKVLAVEEDLAIKKLEYEKIKAQADRRIIRAPADGVITKSFKDEGEYAAPNDPTLFSIVQLNRLIAVFSVPSPAAHDLRNDQVVHLSFPDLSPAEGIVEFVSPITDAESGTVRVKVRIENPKGTYRSGERCTLELARDKKTAKREHAELEDEHRRNADPTSRNAPPHHPEPKLKTCFSPTSPRRTPVIGTTSNVSFVDQGWDGASTPLTRQMPDAPRECDRSSALEPVEGAEQFSAAILELIDKLASADNLQHAAVTLVSELQEYFACQRVAIGLHRRRQGNCRLLAIAGLAQFDPRSEFVRIVQSALDECVLRGSTIVWPAVSETERHGTLACQKLASLSGVPKVVAVPLRDAKGSMAGAMLFLGSEQLDRPAGFRAFLRVSERRLGIWLDLVRRAEPSLVARQLEFARQQIKNWRGKAVLAAVTLAACVLAIPLPYKIRCDCQVQPFTRRFVVAPFEGRLEKALVKQGEVVRQGQVLARIDGHEIRWELAGLVAERSRAAKQRDSAMAVQKVAEAQAAKLEMDRLDLKIQLLEHRAENLEARSPIDGIVISGDLERAEGAPLNIGQTLFEVAPLDQMVVELAVPEDDISYAHDGMSVAVRLDAYPNRKWNGTIAKIHPRAEIRQSQNAFIAELHLDNPDQSLRPGMNGRAKIAGPSRPLAWNLFHKAADWLARKIGC